jgi:hypothetical protein
VVVVLLAVAAGFAVGALVTRQAGPTATVAAPAVAGGLDRHAPSRDGALAAGVAYATLLARLFPLDLPRAKQVAADAASSAYREVLVAAVTSQLVPLQRQAARLPGTTVYRQSVLATRVERYDPARARLAVWVLATIGQAGAEANPVASFATFTLDLVWERAAWRLDGSTGRPGPTPLLDGQPELIDDFDAALEGFTDWRPA